MIFREDKLIVIDRVELNILLIEPHNKICQSFFENLLLLNQEILEYEVMHECIVMSVPIRSSDNFWEYYLKYFSN